VAVQPGTRLGPYEIQAAIGAGGMGEVYRARDTRLQRDVAIKVLPEAFASDIQRMARFEREAKLLASLNYPNIASIYGLEESGSTRALVMELVEGPTLADRIRGGAIPIDEALPIARQVADALEYAHDHNVIHRDLKPANIKVRPDGTVKVLDFGLAKAMSGDPHEGDMANSPTLSIAATQQGVILGTAAYMAPEQARGKEVDRRADVWAFGCVLYEILTGERAFDGRDVTEILAAIVMKEPDFDALPAKTPPDVRNLLRRCLEKEPRGRLQHIGEARIALERVGTATAEPVVATGTSPWLGRRSLVLGLGALLLGVVVTGFVMWRMRPVPTPPSVKRFSIELPADEHFVTLGRSVADISPDGKNVAYFSSKGLMLRPLDQLQATAIIGADAALNVGSTPFFSPDSQWVGFLANGIQKVSISGGAPVRLNTVNTATAPSFSSEAFTGASWTEDDTIFFGQLQQGIWKIAGGGGTAEQVIKVEVGEQASQPQLLPDGQWLLFTLEPRGANSWDQSQIVAQSLATGERIVLVKGGRDARYVPTGHLVYALGNALLAMPFDPSGPRVTGNAVPVVEGVVNTGTGAANFNVANDGSLIYLPEGSASLGSAAIVATRTMVWVSRDGREEPLAAPPRSYSYPRISPDGTKVAVDVRDQASEVWVWDTGRSTLTRLTFDPGQDRFPAWTPDGRRIAFSSTRDGSTGNAFWKAADGTGPAEEIAESSDQRQMFPTSFSPDGSQLLVHGAHAGGDEDDNVSLVTLGSGGKGSVEPLLQTTFAERNAEISPDGRWMAYESNESGRFEVYVRPFPNLDGGRWQVSTSGGAQPAWARSGRELFYRNADALMAVPVRTEGGFVAGNPALLFRGQFVPTLGGRNYDVSPDGRRFLMLKEAKASETAAPQRVSLVVVTNWTEELKQRVPTGTN
jgi:serine/threonine protein kinase